MWVFDLDGTLVDTQKAVRVAYARAGVNMPEGVWGKPWRQWLPLVTINAEFAHLTKNLHYPSALTSHAKELPLLRHARRMRAPILTGASESAAFAVSLRFFGIPPLNIVLTEAMLLDKILWLNKQTSASEITYVDDDSTARAVVANNTRCRVLTPEEALREVDCVIT